MQLSQKFDNRYSQSAIGKVEKDGLIPTSGAKIGKILPKEHGLKIKKHDEVLELPVFDRDEITKIFG